MFKSMNALGQMLFSKPMSNTSPDVLETRIFAVFSTSPVPIKYPLMLLLHLLLPQRPIKMLPFVEVSEGRHICVGVRKAAKA